MSWGYVVDIIMKHLFWYTVVTPYVVALRVIAENEGTIELISN